MLNLALAATIFCRLFLGVYASTAPKLNPLRRDSSNANDGTSIELDFSILDQNKNDASKQVTIMHQHLDTTSKKRDVYRPATDCSSFGPNYRFIFSACRTHATPQSYRVVCYDTQGGYFNLTQHFSNGECDPTEVCVNGPQQGASQWLPGTAYCVKRSNYIEIDRGQLESMVAFNLRQPVGPGQVLAAEAVLTGLDNVTVFQADSLQLDALTLSTVAAPVPAWGTLPGGSVSCNGCSAVELGPVPVGTMRLKIQVVVKSMASAFLYLATVAA